MATRTLWQDLYGMQVQPGTTLAAHVGANPTMAAATDIGIQGTGSANGKFALPLTDHPTIKAPSGSIDSEQARGISPRHQREFNVVQTGEPVEVVMPLLGHAYNASAFLALLLQSGASEVSVLGLSDFARLSAIPYTLADVDNLAYLTRALQPSAGGDQIDLLVKGAICSALQFSGEMGQVLNLEATMHGAKWEQVDLGAGGLGITSNLQNSFASVAPLKYQDSTIAIYDKVGASWVEVFAPSISLTINNNADFNFYNDDAASSIHLGRLSVEGSITIPYGQTTVGNNYMIDRFLAGDTMRLAWYWGQTGAAIDIANDYQLNSADFDTDPFDRYKNDAAATDPKNFLSIVANVRVADYEMVGENEVQVECTLEGVTDDDYNAIEVFALYDKTNLIRL